MNKILLIETATMKFVKKTYLNQMQENELKQKQESKQLREKFLIKKYNAKLYTPAIHYSRS